MHANQYKSVQTGANSLNWYKLVQIGAYHFKQVQMSKNSYKATKNMQSVQIGLTRCKAVQSDAYSWKSMEIPANL